MGKCRLWIWIGDFGPFPVFPMVYTTYIENKKEHSFVATSITFLQPALEDTVAYSEERTSWPAHAETIANTPS